MISNAKNKQMETDVAEPREWHFAGSGEYVPQTITAPTREAAHEEWLRTRKSAAKVETLSEKTNTENSI